MRGSLETYVSSLYYTLECSTSEPPSMPPIAAHGLSHSGPAVASMLIAYNPVTTKNRSGQPLDIPSLLAPADTTLGHSTSEAHNNAISSTSGTELSSGNRTGSVVAPVRAEDSSVQIKILEDIRSPDEKLADNIAKRLIEGLAERTADDKELSRGPQRGPTG